MAQVKKAPAVAEPEDGSILPGPVTIPAARYAFKPGVPCAFCDDATADRTANVDLNWPVLDVVSVRDNFVKELPCCARCKAMYQRMDEFYIGIPRIFGYPVSTVHRLIYVPRVRRWLKVHGLREPLEPKVSAAWRDDVCARFQWVMYYGLLWSLTALAIIDVYPEPLALRGPSYLVMWLIAILGAASAVAGLIQWVRFKLPSR